MRTQVLRPSELSAGEKATWSRLQHLNPDLASPFLSWQFAQAVEAVNPKARVCVFTRDSEPVAFLPFQWAPGWLGHFGVAERIGGEMSDYFGMIAGADFRVTPAEAVRAAGIATLNFSHLDQTQTLFGLTGEAPRVGLRIEFAEGPERYFELLRSRKKSLVRETERRLRRIEQEAGPIRLIPDAADRPDLLEQLIKWKIDQYDRTGKSDEGTPALTTTAGAGLLRRLHAVRDPECTGVLSALFAGEQWVAFHFGLKAGTQLHYWFPVYNPAFAAHAPGRLLLFKIIQQSEELAINCIDRGEGDSAVKRDYATAEHHYLLGVWQRPGLRGLVGHLGLALAWRLGQFVG